jgi:pimeloyl-ACP methyl ester carboxylesterase
LERLSEISAPTLLIVGDKDVPGMQLLTRRIHQMISGSSILIIPG